MLKTGQQEGETGRHRDTEGRDEEMREGINMSNEREDEAQFER